MGIDFLNTTDYEKDSMGTNTASDFEEDSHNILCVYQSHRGFLILNIYSRKYPRSFS